MRSSPYQGNFGSGELSPLMRGRKEVDRYSAGLAKCYNAIVTQQGPVVRRPGTRYVATSPAVGLGDQQRIRLIPFKFSSTVNYIIEIGFGFARFYTNRGVVESSPGVPYVITFPSVAWGLVKYTQSLDTLYFTDSQTRPFKLVRYGNADWRIEYIYPKDGPYLTTNRVYSQKLKQTTITSSTASFATDGTSANVTAVADNGSGHPRLTTSGGTFTTGNRVYLTGLAGFGIPDGSYTVTYISGTSFDLESVTYSSGGAAAGTIDYAPFENCAVGQLWRFQVTSTLWIWGTFTAITAPNAATVRLDPDNFPAFVYVAATTYSTNIWRLGVWGAGSDTPYPSCVCFHDDRLYFGGGGNVFQRIDGSYVGDYENFQPSEFAAGSTTDNTVISDSVAVSFTLASQTGNQVHWIQSDDHGMPIGTSGGPWILRPNNLGGAITPTNVSAKKIFSSAVADRMPVFAGKAVVYLDSSTRRLRELSYFYNIDSYAAVDITELSEHIPAIGVDTEPAFQSSPQSIMWMGRNDGALIGTSYDRTVDVLRVGWHEHALGGRSDVTNAIPVVESVAVIPSPDGLTDDVWLSVKRLINGGIVRHVEYMTPIFQTFMDPEYAVFSDSSLAYDNPINIGSVGFTSPMILSTADESGFPVAHGFSTGDKVRLYGFIQNATDETQIGDTLWEVTVLNASEFSVAFDATGYTVGNSLIPEYGSDFAQVRKVVHTLTGLDHLEGETVAILGDGAVYEPQVVVGGAVSIPLDQPGIAVAQIGLPYTTRIQQMRVEGGSKDGTSFGKLRKVEQCSLMLDRSGAFKYGMNFDNMYTHDFRSPEDSMDAAVPLFSGVVAGLKLDSDYDTENQIAIEVTDPTPFTLLAIMPQQTAYDL